MTQPTTPPGKPWGGRFSSTPHPDAERFTASLSVDRRLWPYDLQGSEAWAKALGRASLLTESELQMILKGLAEIRHELESGTFPFRPELEDIHMNIERRLVETIGPVGGKLHTGRSRNDQIALDERLYLRDVVVQIDRGLREVQAALVERAEEWLGVPLPGYTHLQLAQPILLSHHLLAYVFMVQRDRERFGDLGKRLEIMPLGSGALAGSAYPIDRHALAKELGFRAPSPNSLDAVSDRDYCAELLAACAIAGMHWSRLATDLALWASAEFGFVEIDDRFATGSSMMPQKKNPDVLELIRGKCGRLYGNLVALLTTMKGLPLAYNSDMQEDKPPLFDSVDTIEAIATVLPPLLRTLKVNAERCREAAAGNFSTATDLADYLVKKGLPFREAHEVVGRVVRHALETKRSLEELPLETLKNFSSFFETDVKEAVTLEASLAARNIYGGTGPDAVRKALAEAKELLAET
ncbi:MAG TPA: argininosuccinate lyase [Methylomirabilota bacterium]|nr:argininosuccinate lyase [Methylomirabilota bacterium]